MEARLLFRQRIVRNPVSDGVDDEQYLSFRSLSLLDVAVAELL